MPLSCNNSDRWILETGTCPCTISPHVGNPAILFVRRKFTGPGGEAFTTSEGAVMRILLYNPDNGVTRNFMPHLWMFLLQALTPPGHEVLLIDGNAHPLDEDGIARLVREQRVGLVGIGAMTRMIAKAYRMADAVRAAGVQVVMGGPHVTEMADEALGRDGRPLRSEEHTSELQSRSDLVCRLLLEKKKQRSLRNMCSNVAPNLAAF